jgi:hypothetical protein
MCFAVWSHETHDTHVLPHLFLTYIFHSVWFNQKLNILKMCKLNVITITLVGVHMIVNIKLICVLLVGILSVLSVKLLSSVL